METTFNLNLTISLLLVEDDDDSRETLAVMLSRKFPAVTVYSADNGRTGLDLFKTHLQDIVITDINMPGMCGFQMTDKIRTIKPDTKFIVLTADTEKTAMEHGVGKGFEVDHFILKPVNIAGLFAVIEQCIAEAALQK